MSIAYRSLTNLLQSTACHLRATDAVTSTFWLINILAFVIDLIQLIFLCKCAVFLSVEFGNAWVHGWYYCCVCVHIATEVCLFGNLITNHLFSGIFPNIRQGCTHRADWRHQRLKESRLAKSNIRRVTDYQWQILRKLFPFFLFFIWRLLYYLELYKSFTIFEIW